MEVSVKTKIKKILSDPKAFKELDSIVEAGAFIIEAEYKKQSPVDKGFLRNSVTTTGKGLERIVKAKQSYAKYLHQGTYRMKGQPDSGYTTGRVRSHQVAWGIGGVRPNKFADRARAIAGPKTVRYIDDEILKLINK